MAASGLCVASGYWAAGRAARTYHHHGLGLEVLLMGIDLLVAQGLHLCGIFVQPGRAVAAIYSSQQGVNQATGGRKVHLEATDQVALAGTDFSRREPASYQSVAGAGWRQCPLSSKAGAKVAVMRQSPSLNMSLPRPAPTVGQAFLSRTLAIRRPANPLPRMAVARRNAW